MGNARKVQGRKPLGAHGPKPASKKIKKSDLKSHSTKNKYKKMKKQTILAMALCLTSLSTVQAKNFWLKLDTQHVEAQQAQQCISQWLAVPRESIFELVKDETDYLGFRHQTYQQYIAGVRVEGGIVKVHSRQGVVTAANGHVVERAELKQAVRRVSHNGALTADGRELVLVPTATGARYAYKHFDRFGMADVLTDAETGEELKRLPRRFTADVKTTGQSRYSGEVEFTINPTADGRYMMTDSARRIFTLDARQASTDTTPYAKEGTEFGFDVEKYLLANTRPLYNTDPHWSLLRVDSLVFDSITDEQYWVQSVSIYYTDLNGEQQPHNEVVTEWDNDYMADFTRNYIEASVPFSVQGLWFDYDLGKFLHYSFDAVYTEPGVYPWQMYDEDGKLQARGRIFVSTSSKHCAIDAHWGMEQIYDFYKETFHRDSYDDKGAPIYNVMYPVYVEKFTDIPILYSPSDNAGAQVGDGFGYMVYGSSGTKYDALVALDIMGHEFTHLVTYKTSNLQYLGESGALNESFSDILGISIKQKVKNLPHNWLQGDEIILDPEARCGRDMQNPESKGHPGTYQGEYWRDPTGEYDYGGVHFNSGVQNHWYYYLVEGGTYTDRQGISHTFAGIGLDRAVQIAYRNMAEILTPTAQYRDAVLGSLQAAEDLYGTDSAERQAVVDAWAAVGLMSDGTSGIHQATASANAAADDAIYRLDGTRAGAGSTQGLAPGIYIQHGKKVVVK